MQAVTLKTCDSLWNWWHFWHLRTTIREHCDEEWQGRAFAILVMFHLASALQGQGDILDKLSMVLQLVQLEVGILLDNQLGQRTRSEELKEEESQCHEQILIVDSHVKLIRLSHLLWARCERQEAGGVGGGWNGTFVLYLANNSLILSWPPLAGNTTFSMICTISPFLLDSLGFGKLPACRFLNTTHWLEPAHTDGLIVREHLLKKRMFSFGHCPNYLPLFRATCTSFSAVKAKYIYCIF